MTEKKPLTEKQLEQRRSASQMKRAIKRARSSFAKAGGLARWANTTPEARSERMRDLANTRHQKGKADVESSS